MLVAAVCAPRPRSTHPTVLILCFYKPNGVSVPPASRCMFSQAGRSRLRPRLRPAICFYKRGGPTVDPAFVPLYVFTSGAVPPSVPPSPRYMFVQAKRARLGLLDSLGLHGLPSTAPAPGSGMSSPSRCAAHIREAPRVFAIRSLLVPTRLA